MDENILKWLEEWLVLCLKVDVKEKSTGKENIKTMYQSLNNKILEKFISLYINSNDHSVKLKPETVKLLFDNFENPQIEYNRLFDRVKIKDEIMAF